MCYCVNYNELGIGDESGESVRSQNCKVRQRIINCRREGSVKLCIQHKESELWLTAFTNEIENLLGPVVRKVDNAIHRINLYPVDNAIDFHNTYPPDSDISGE